MSVEYLVTGKNPAPQTQATDMDSDHARSYKKYHSLIQKAESLSQAQLQAIERLIALI